MLVDSHCHLDCIDLAPFEGDVGLLLDAALAQGVSHFLCVCIDLVNFPSVLAIAERYANVFASVGVHPNEMPAEANLTETLIRLGHHPKVIAVGETGLDYYRTPDAQHALQQQQFVDHIQAAIALQKPLIIHTREARKDTLALLASEKAETVGGVLHCFTEDWDMAKQAIDMNFYISLSGIVTFPKATQCHEVAKKVPLDRLLIETDSPYLAPVPFRGKQNQPAYVRYVAEAIAALRGISLETLGEATTENFFRCFRVDSGV